MLRFYADFFTRACVYLERLHTRVLTLDQWQTEVEIDVIVVKKECDRIGFKHLAEQAQRIIDKAKRVEFAPESVQAQKNEIHVLLQELRLGIEQKLRSCLFLRVHSDKQSFYSEEELSLFGSDVQTKFDQASHDIAEAGRCFALERWDACVHHLMLATEIAMRKWAKDLKFKTKVPVELEDMEAILREAEAKLKVLKNQRRSAKRDRAIKYLAETSAHFGFIKDAWRKHSAHGRERYDERKAKNLMNHVEAFMRMLATESKASGGA